MIYKSKETIEATQWFKNGDHPLDDMFRPFEDTGIVPTEPREGKIVRYFRHPKISEFKVCSCCGFLVMSKHGWLDSGANNGDGETVCPGDYIVFNGDVEKEKDFVNPNQYYCKSKQNFEEQYEPLNRYCTIRRAKC